MSVGDWTKSISYTRCCRSHEDRQAVTPYSVTALRDLGKGKTFHWRTKCCRNFSMSLAGSYCLQIVLLRKSTLTAHTMLSTRLSEGCTTIITARSCRPCGIATSRSRHPVSHHPRCSPYSLM